MIIVSSEMIPKMCNGIERPREMIADFIPVHVGDMAGQVTEKWIQAFDAQFFSAIQSLQTENEIGVFSHRHDGETRINHGKIWWEGKRRFQKYFHPQIHYRERCSPRRNIRGTIVHLQDG
jgi:hypothetical protein